MLLSLIAFSHDIANRCAVFQHLTEWQSVLSLAESGLPLLDFFILFVPETTSLQAEGRLDADVHLPFSSYSYMKLQAVQIHVLFWL